MAATATTGRNLADVHTFIAGAHAGDAEGEVWHYSDRDLAEIARNFALLSRGPRPLHRVPVVVTHDGVEAYGWVASARARGGDFYTDWRDVELKLKAAIEERRFDSVSAEIRRDFKAPDGRVIPGQYLYRVSVLGADVPRGKGMEPLSAAKWFSEKGAGRKLQGVRPMATDAAAADTGSGSGSGTSTPGTAAEALQQELLDQGISQELLDSLDEPQLVLLYRDVTTGGTGEPADVSGTSTMSDPATLTRADLLAGLAALGHAEAELSGKSDEELRALLAQSRQSGGTRTMSDTRKPASSRAAGGSGGHTPDPAADLGRKFADLQATVRRLEGQAASLAATQQAAQVQAQARLKDATKQRVYDAVRQAQAEKRVEAWELDESDPQTLSLPQQLLLLDATTPVTRKFADATGKEVTVSRTPLDDALEALKKRPARKFSELAVGGGQGNAASKRMLDLAKQMTERRRPGGRTLEERLNMLPSRAAR